MIDFGVVVLLLSTSSREKDLGHTLATECSHKFAVVVKRAVVEDALHKQGIADVLLIGLRRVPEETLMLGYYLLA